MNRMQKVWIIHRAVRRSSRWLRRGLMLALAAGWGYAAAAAQFTVSLDRESVVVGEPVTLTLSCEGGTPQDISSLPQVDGLQISSGVSSSFNTTMTPNGTRTIQSYAVQLVPTRTGEFVIPALEAKINGEKLTSQPLRLKVMASDPAAPPASYASMPAFLWPVWPKTNLFIGETVTIEMRLYVRGEWQYSDPQLPLSGEGFTFSSAILGQGFRRRVGTSPFTVVPIYFAVTPVKTGTLSVGPLEGGIVLGSGDIFSLGPPPRRVSLPVPAQKFEVSPLPSRGVPPDFNGAVGNFTLSVTAGPTNVAVGDPLTVRIRIAGEGRLDSLTLPEQSAWHDLKSYPPSAKVESQNPLNIEGAKVFEQVVIPQNAELKALPPVSFSFFDPSQKTYRTLTQPEIPLRIRPGGSTPVPASLAGGNEPPQPAQDIVPIKRRIGSIGRPSAPLLTQTWFITLQGVPALALIAVIGWRRRAEALANNPRLRRQRQVDQTVREGLNDLRRFATANQSDDFFATLFRLLQERLGERLDLPASAITEAVVDEQLAPRDADESLLTNLRELFQICNLARYAPLQTSQELAAVIPRAETTLRQLKDLDL